MLGDLLCPVRDPGLLFLMVETQPKIHSPLQVDIAIDRGIISFNLCFASVAQLDRASVFGTEGWGFESLRRYFLGAFTALGTVQPLWLDFCF